MYRALVVILLVGCNPAAQSSSAPATTPPPIGESTRPVREPSKPARDPAKAMEARVVQIAREACTNCGGDHILLEAVVDGGVKRLYAGGHCFRAMLSVGDTVTVEATFTESPTEHPGIGSGRYPCLASLPATDGVATIVSPANALTGP